MKKLFLILFLFAFNFGFAQVDLSKVSKSNTWFKLGVNAGVPIGSFGNSSSFALGGDLSVQFLETKASGIGLKVGYLNYFGKDNADDIGVMPLAVLYRYYPESTGFFAGLEVGYALVNNMPLVENGIFARPHAGIHTDNWNFFAYFDYISTEEGIDDLQAIGVGVTRNLRIK